MKEEAFRSIKVGYEVSISKTITEKDIESFSKLTGDFNPVHIDNEIANKTVFKGRIAHGILIAGLISAAVSKLPGIIIYLSQDLLFLRPTKPGETIQASAKVLEKINDKNELRLKTICTNKKEQVVIDGEARVKVLDIEESPVI